MLILSFLLLILPLPVIGVMLSWAGLYRSPYKWKKYFFFFIYPVTMFAYSVEPSYVNDLSRYFEQVNLFSRYTFTEAFHLLSDGLFVRNVIFWLIAKTGDVHLLPLLTTGISYAICYYITCDSARRLRSESYIYLVLAFEVLVIPFFNVVCNVRNITAFLLISLAAYRELVEKKRDLILVLLYILPCFLHKTGVTMLALRMLIVIFERYRILSLVIIIGLPKIIDFAYAHVSWIRGAGIITVVLRRLILSAHNYLYDDSEYAANFQNSRFGIIRITVFVIIGILAYYCYQYIIKHHESALVRFVTFAFELCIMTLACGAFDTPAYWRYAVAAYVTCTPVLLMGLSHENTDIHINRTMFYALGGLAILRFAMGLRYTWTRMDFGGFIINSMFTNIYGILIKIFSGGLNT